MYLHYIKLQCNSSSLFLIKKINLTVQKFAETFIAKKVYFVFNFKSKFTFEDVQIKTNIKILLFKKTIIRRTHISSDVKNIRIIKYARIKLS